MNLFNFSHQQKRAPPPYPVISRTIKEPYNLYRIWINKISWNSLLLQKRRFVIIQKRWLITNKDLEEEFISILFSLHEQFCKFLLQYHLFVIFDCTSMNSCCKGAIGASQNDCKDQHEHWSWVHFEIVAVKITDVLSIDVISEWKRLLL